MTQGVVVAFSSATDSFESTFSRSLSERGGEEEETLEARIDVEVRE